MIFEIYKYLKMALKILEKTAKTLLTFYFQTKIHAEIQF